MTGKVARRLSGRGWSAWDHGALVWRPRGLLGRSALCTLISAMVVLTSIRMDLMLGCSSVLWTRMKKMLRQVPGFRSYPDLLADGSQNGFLGMNLPLCVVSVFP